MVSSFVSINHADVPAGLRSHLQDGYLVPAIWCRFAPSQGQGSYCYEGFYVLGLVTEYVSGVMRVDLGDAHGKKTGQVSQHLWWNPALSVSATGTLISDLQVVPN